MIYKCLQVFIIFLLISCSSDKKLFLKSGNIYNTDVWNYCADSLGIYHEFYGNYSVSNESFFETKLTKTEKLLLKKVNFNKQTDKILYHSDLSKNKNKFHDYTQIGILRKNINLNTYKELKIENEIVYIKLDYENKIKEVVYPINYGNYFSEVIYPLSNKIEDNEKFSSVVFDTNNEQIKRTLKKIKEKKCNAEDFFELSNNEYERDSLKNYLTYKLLESKREKINNKEKGTYYQYLATYLSLANRNNEAESTFNLLLGKDMPNKILSSKTTNINFLSENIKDKNFVILNEAHHIPKHRYLAGLLLKELYNNGFRYFGLEAINVIDELQKNNFPNQEYGFYTRESNLSNLVREAINMGFKVFDYECFEGGREICQAKSIYDKTFSTDKNAKVFIYCGYSHADEHNNNRKWMAQVFNETNQINPFTIDQTSNKENFNDNKIRILDLEKSDMKCDLYLNNSLTIENNCFSLRKSQNINLQIKPLKEKLNILLVYYKNEFETIKNPVPTFVKVLDEKIDKISTNLCYGDYIIVLKNITNDIVDKYEIEVK